MLTESDLRHFTGTERYHRHGLMRSIVFTDGVKHVADAGGAYWLIDKIAAAQMNPKIAAEPFQVWRMVVTGSKASLTCDDGDQIGVGNSKAIVFHSEEIGFTDFPLEKIEIWVEGGVILLPSEH